ncbi:MAG: hypothetical protein RL653_2961 [Pseudomonadota bacterium]|jgi:flagellar biosynthesis component FlhA
MTPSLLQAEAHIAPQPRLVLQFGADIAERLSGADLLGQLKAAVVSVRTRVANAWGFSFGGVILRDSARVSPGGWELRVDSQVVASGECTVGGWMLLAHEGPLPDVGRPAEDPSFGMPVRWITDAEAAPYREDPRFVLVDWMSVVVTSFEAAVERSLPSLVGFEQLDALLARAEVVPPALASAVADAGLPRDALLRLLRSLLASSRPLLAMALILELAVLESPRLRAGDEQGWIAAVRDRLSPV